MGHSYLGNAINPGYPNDQNSQTVYAPNIEPARFVSTRQGYKQHNCLDMAG